MDPMIPKNEREHWAADEIHRLRDQLNGGCPMHPLREQILPINLAGLQNFGRGALVHLSEELIEDARLPQPGEGQSGPAYVTFTPKTEEEMAADDARWRDVSQPDLAETVARFMRGEITSEERDRIVFRAEREPCLNPPPHNWETVGNRRVCTSHIQRTVEELLTTSIPYVMVEQWLSQIYVSACFDHRTGGGPFYRDSHNIPPGIKASIDAHVMTGKPTGSFLQAVLENDLKTVVTKADESNYLLLGAIVGYCCNEIPVVCWGSEDAVAAWQRKGGWLAVYPGEPLRMKGLVVK